jgi:hypothetical protein
MFIVYIESILGNKSSKLISSSKLILLSMTFISYILLSISLTTKGILLVKAGSISNIISLSIKLGRRVI